MPEWELLKADNTSSSAPGPPFPVARSGAQFPASARPKDPASAAYSEGVNEWELPTWLQTALNRLRSHHQNDMFTIAKRPRTPQDPPNAPEETFLRIRCHDCPGRQYALGPQLSLTNFEVHLNNRNHRQSVANRLSGLASN